MKTWTKILFYLAVVALLIFIVYLLILWGKIPWYWCADSMMKSGPTEVCGWSFGVPIY